MKLFLCLCFFVLFQSNASAEVIRVNCSSKVIDYGFVVVVDTINKTVLLNDNSLMRNVIITKSQIYFEMNLEDKSKGDYFSHTINRVTGVLSLKIEPNGQVDYYQCSKITSNKF